MSVPYVEYDQANEEAKAFYESSSERFTMLLNIFKMFGHIPEHGTAFTNAVRAILKDGELTWKTKELLILKATLRNECQYCVVQHEAVSARLGISDDTIAALEGDKYRSSQLFDEGEKALLDLTVQIGVDANRVSQDLWHRLHAHWSHAQIVEAAWTIAFYIAVSKFGDAMGVELEPVFHGKAPILEVQHS